MKKLFICLANSRKYSGRCIAGIELFTGANGQLRITCNGNNQPKWIRPVSQTEFGELGNEWVRHIRLGDLVEVETIETVAHATSSYQTENTPFEPESIVIKDHIDLEAERLKKLSIPDKMPLFGCRRHAMPTENAVALGHSLQLIQVKAARLHFREVEGRRPQEKLQFTYNNNIYNLPMTDIEFFEKYLSDNHVLEKAKEVYLTVSLSQPYEGKMYKLAAGVFCV